MWPFNKKKKKEVKKVEKKEIVKAVAPVQDKPAKANPTDTLAEISAKLKKMQEKINPSE